MTNVIKADFPTNLPLDVITKEAHKIVREEFWGIEDYDMFIGYMSQFISNPSILSFDVWVSIVEQYNVVSIK